MTVVKTRQYSGNYLWNIAKYSTCYVPTSNFGRTVPCSHSRQKKSAYADCRAGLSVATISEVPSRYYRVPRYFFTVLTVAQNRWLAPNTSSLPHGLIWLLCVCVGVADARLLQHRHLHSLFSCPKTSAIILKL